MPKTGFKGVLAKPRAPRRVGLLASEDARERLYESWAAEDAAKLAALCEHYGIAEGPHQHALVALELAREFVPGFQEQKTKGRPTKWDDVTKSMLVVEVRRLIAPGSGPTAACKQLATQEPWASFLEEKDADRTLGKDPAEALRQVYQSFKSDRFAHVAWDAFKWHRETDTVDEWDRFVSDTLADARRGK